MQRTFKNCLGWLALVVGGIAIVLGIGGMREPKYSARAWYSFNERSFAAVSDARFEVLNHSEGSRRQISYGEGVFIMSHPELMLSQKTFERAFTSLGMEYRLRAYKAAVEAFRVRRAGVWSDGRSRWYLEFQHDDPEHCARFVNAVLRSYAIYFSGLLKSKGIVGVPENLFKVESFAARAEETNPAAKWIFLAGTFMMLCAIVSFGRQVYIALRIAFYR